MLVNLLATDRDGTADVEPAGLLTRFDIAAFVEKHGLLALRDYLERFPTKDLRDYVKEEQLSTTAVSKLAKAQVINRIMMAAKEAA